MKSIQSGGLRLVIIVFNVWVVYTAASAFYAAPPEYGPDYRFLIPGWVSVVNIVVAGALIITALCPPPTGSASPASTLDGDLVSPPTRPLRWWYGVIAVATVLNPFLFLVVLLL